jgi:hypothetical protein
MTRDDTCSGGFAVTGGGSWTPSGLVTCRGEARAMEFLEIEGDLSYTDMRQLLPFIHYGP